MAETEVSCVRKIGLSFKHNFKVQIFFNENNVSSFVTDFLFMFTYLSDQ